MPNQQSTCRAGEGNNLAEELPRMRAGTAENALAQPGPVQRVVGRLAPALTELHQA